MCCCRVLHYNAVSCLDLKTTSRPYATVRLTWSLVMSHAKNEYLYELPAMNGRCQSKRLTSIFVTIALVNARSRLSRSRTTRSISQPRSTWTSLIRLIRKKLMWVMVSVFKMIRLVLGLRSRLWRSNPCKQGQSTGRQQTIAYFEQTISFAVGHWLEHHSIAEKCNPRWSQCSCKQGKLVIYMSEHESVDSWTWPASHRLEHCRCHQIR